MEASFEGFSVKNIPRGDNEQADFLAKLAAQELPHPQKFSSKLSKHLRLSLSKGLYS
jgi:beta-lactamase class D